MLAFAEAGGAAFANPIFVQTGLHPHPFREESSTLWILGSIRHRHVGFSEHFLALGVGAFAVRPACRREDIRRLLSSVAYELVVRGRESRNRKRHAFGYHQGALHQERIEGV